MTEIKEMVLPMYERMSEKELRAALRQICNECNTEEEIVQRIKSDLEFPGEPEVGVHTPHFVPFSEEEKAEMTARGELFTKDDKGIAYIQLMDSSGKVIVKL